MFHTFCFHTSMRFPQVRTQSFLPSICYIYTICSRIVLGFDLSSILPRIYMPDVVSVRQTRSLPPASFSSSSPRTPLLLAMCLALSTRTRDFHPLDCAHAVRTRKKVRSFCRLLTFLLIPQVYIIISIKPLTQNC